MIAIPIRTVLKFFLTCTVRRHVGDGGTSKGTFSEAFCHALFFVPMIASMAIITVVFDGVFRPCRKVVKRCLGS